MKKIIIILISIIAISLTGCDLIFDLILGDEEESISVTSISVNRSNITLTEGESYKLSATIYPNNATNQTIEWSTSNSSYVSVSSNGLITARYKGSAIITVKSKENGSIKDECYVTVIKENVDPDPDPEPEPEPKYDDAYEDNDIFEQAKTISLGNYNLYYHDPDWFKLNVSGINKLKINVTCDDSFKLNYGMIGIYSSESNMIVGKELPISNLEVDVSSYSTIYILVTGLVAGIGYEPYTLLVNKIEVPITYTVGDIGPAGGYIFYVDEADEFSDWDYLEAAPYGWYNGGNDPEFYWTSPGEGSTKITHTTYKEVGKGEINTSRIVQCLGSGDYAAAICYEYTSKNLGVTFDDWFLPSKDELMEMYTNLKSKGLGNLSTDFYWCSTEYDSDNAWYQTYYNGGMHYYDKYALYGSKLCIRAVRAF